MREKREVGGTGMNSQKIMRLVGRAGQAQPQPEPGEGEGERGRGEREGGRETNSPKAWVSAYQAEASQTIKVFVQG